MRIILSTVVWCIVVLSSGCAIWEKETTNRGGYLDHLADQHWLKADSKSMRALRAFAIQVSLARIASVSAKNDTDRQLLAIRIGATTKRFLPIAACASENNPLKVTGVGRDPCFYYDSAMVDYSTALFDLAMVALPFEDAKKLLNAATGSVVNPLNLADLIDSLLSIARDGLKYGRVVGALYRDTVELEVQIWLSTPEIDDRPAGYRVTEADVAALREIYSRKSDDMAAWISAIAALRSRGLEPVPHPKFFNQLGGLMKYICDLITTEPRAVDACKADLPTTLEAPLRVLGPTPSQRLSSTISTGGRAPSSSTSTRSSIGSRPSSSSVAVPTRPVLTCPPTRGKFDTSDENAKKLTEYVRAGPNGDRADRVKNLESMFALPNIRSKLISGRTPRLVTVLNTVECKDVRDLMAIQAKEKGFIE